MGRRESGGGRGKEREVGIEEVESRGEMRVVERGSRKRGRGRGIKLVTCSLHTVLPPLQDGMAATLLNNVFIFLSSHASFDPTEVLRKAISSHAHRENCLVVKSAWCGL